MNSLTYRLPAELENKLNDLRRDATQRPANAFMQDGRLNMGPAIILAMLLSTGCWAAVIRVGIRLFH